MAKLSLGNQFGYWNAQPHEDFVGAAVEAEKLGYEAVWSAESWGNDVFTPLAFIAAATTRIKLGTAICQMAARTPTCTAMHALTLDHMSKGRMILGLGVSGPQVVEGWYGRPFAKPVSRSREYIDIIKQVLRREAPVTSDGEFYPLPYTGEGAWGLGKPLKPITHPLRADLPIWLGAEGPNNVRLSAEVCDGWLPLWYSPYKTEVYSESIKDAKPGFEIAVNAQMIVCDDVQQGINMMKPMIGFYVGGMGARDRNFHKELLARFGYEEEADKIQDLFFDGKREEAIAAVPEGFIDEIALIGPMDRIKDRLAAWEDSPVTMLLTGGLDRNMMRTAAEVVLG